MTELIYRVQRRADGKFSTGTTHPRFTKQGKFFSSLQAVHAHLTWFLKGPAWMDYEGDLRVYRHKKPNPDDYVVIEYNVVEANTIPLSELT